MELRNEKNVGMWSSQELPSLVSAANVKPERQRWSWKRILIWSCLAYQVAFHSHSLDFLWDSDASTESLCPQVPALYPSKNADLFRNVTELYETEAYKQRAISWLSGSIRVPYVVNLNISFFFTNMFELWVQDRML
jgi:hypothetical protein